MKKLLAILLVLLMAVGTCYAEAAAPLSAYDEELTLMTTVTMNETTKFDETNPEKKSYRENRWINAFKDNLNIKVDYSWIASDGDSNMSKWAAAIATGNVPDFAMVDNKVYKLLLDAELVADCTDIYANYVSDGYKSLLDQAALDQMTFDGKLMGLPFPQKGYHGATLLFVRQDWLDKLGLSYPTNYEELVTVAKAFRDNKLGGEETIGMMFSMNASDGMLNGFFNMFGAYQNYWIKKDGKLEWSNIQPEMKTALVELQKLYNDGVINKDFAVTTGDLAKEYIAGGKTGVFFATAWNTTTSIQALYENDPTANIVSTCIFGADGNPIPFQTNTPSVGKVFVSKNCKNPEAVAKMLSLSYELTSTPEGYLTYGADLENFMWFKYLPWGDMPKTQLADLVNAYEVGLAYEEVKAGTLTDYNAYDWTDVTNGSRLERYIKALNKESTELWMPLTYGADGTYTKLYHAFNAGLHLPNAYMGLSTETQDLMGDVINDALNTAIYEVIMGADISEFEKACEAWLKNGGEMIVEEINEAAGL